MATGEKPGAEDRARTVRARRGKKKAEPRSTGLTPAQVASDATPSRIGDLIRAVEADGGRALGAYRDPIGGNWQILAALPIDRVVPTPFQRDLSEAHVTRLAGVISRLERYLDPVVTVRTEEGVYWTPNGHHRTAAVKSLGGRSIVALVLPEEEVAYRILALNTEKAHNLREKSLEVIRMARALAAADPRPEKEFSLEFEEPAFLTLGLCYEEKGRFAGGAYHPVLKRIDAFMTVALAKALERRRARAGMLLDLDEAVAAAVKGLKERGFESPYLRAFVVARVNPLRFQRGAKAAFEPTLEKMIASARRFDPSKVRADQLARAQGVPEG